MFGGIEFGDGCDSELAQMCYAVKDNDHAHINCGVIWGV